LSTAEDEEEGPGPVNVTRWSWLAYFGSLVNLLMVIAGNISGHLEDVVTMIVAEIRRREDAHKFREEVHADLESLPVKKE
jgi:hypothetical protein